MWRCCGRYGPGQRFGKHVDDSVDLGNGISTQYTVLIYLTGSGMPVESRTRSKPAAPGRDSTALVGGHTIFYGTLLFVGSVVDQDSSVLHFYCLTKVAPIQSKLHPFDQSSTCQHLMQHLQIYNAFERTASAPRPFPHWQETVSYIITDLTIWRSCMVCSTQCIHVRILGLPTPQCYCQFLYNCGRFMRCRPSLVSVISAPVQCQCLCSHWRCLLQGQEERWWQALPPRLEEPSCIAMGTAAWSMRLLLSPLA